MGDNVSFKVFLKNNDEQEVRRFVIDKNVSTSFDYLVGKLRVIFPQIQRSEFTVGWTDDDGDHVTITTDEELIIALTEMAGPLYRLTVTVKKANQAQSEEKEREEAVVHHGVTCDGCEMANITGPRYKCVQCDDYDLCGGCEAAGRHPGHNMMKITTPGNVFPHRLFKRIQRLQEKAEKKTGCGSEKWNEKLEKDMKQVEEQLKNLPQCGFSAPAQQCFGFGPRGRGLFRGGRGGGGWRGRGGWAGAAPAWAAMMSGWTGEQQLQAGTSGQEKKPEGGEKEQHQEKHEEAVRAAEEAARQAHAQAHSEAQAAAGAAAFLTGSADYLQNVGSFVAAALDPLGIDVKIDIETPEGRKSCHVSRQASTASASTSAGQEQDKGEKENEKEKEEEQLEEKVEEKKEEEKEVVINEEKKEDSAPATKAATPSDDEEDWTVVTDKKEAGAAGLYPSLTENPPADVPTAPVASHPDPKIQVALQAMMNMGFSNEGGWLSSLLEAKNGDIGKVLDILQPVKK